MTTAHPTPAGPGSCWECGYSLRGLETPRCPECGRPFDPADESTMNMGREVGRLAARLMRPPGWPMYLLLAATVLVSLWACVVPTRRGAFSDTLTTLVLVGPALWRERVANIWGDVDSPHARFLLAAALWSTVAACWIARRVARGVAVRWLSGQPAAPFAYWRRWLVVPVIFGATVLACMTRLPTYAGFWASKPWLERAVREAKADPGGGLPPRVIGVFGKYPAWPSATSKTGRSWLQVDVDSHEAIVRIGHEVAFMRRHNGDPPTLDPRFRATRLSGHWFLVEPEPAPR